LGYSAVESRKQEIADRVKEHRARLQERAQERVNGFAERMAKRMETAVSRLESIAAKVQTRMDKLEELGADVSEAQILLDEALALAEPARADIAAFLDIASAELSSEDPKAGVDAIREAASIAKDSIRAMHAALVAAVRELGEAADALDMDGDNDSDEDEATDTENSDEEVEAMDDSATE